MKKFINLVFINLTLIFISSFIFYSCFQNENDIPPSTLEMRDTLIYKKGSKIPYTGTEKARIENKIIEYEVVNGMKQGDFNLYYENGNIEIKGQMEKNKNIGMWRYYYESGQVESEGEFVNNLPNNEWKWYYRSGKLREIGKFKNGKRIGLWNQYDENGNITEEKEFVETDSTETEIDFLEKLKNNIKY